MELSNTYTVRIQNVEWVMDGIVIHVYCKHLSRGMENGWNFRVKCKHLTRRMESGWNCHTRML